MEDKRVSIRRLAFAAGSLSGLLLAASSQILLDHLNIELAAVWGEEVTPSAQIGSALAWWAIAGTALAGGYVAAMVTRSMLQGERSHAWLVWPIGVAVLALLAFAGHFAGTPSDFDPPAHVAASFAGMAGALIASGMGAVLALRR